MNVYKITSHFLPWEIDYCMLMFMQLKKSKYYLDTKENQIKVEMELNLSNYIIDWNKSQLPKSFFKEKFLSLAPLLKDFNFNLKIYDGDELYGCLDTCRNTKEQDVDYYINISPDMYFNESLLWYMIESSKQIKNKYFILTPQIPKMWDITWDVITNKKYLNHPYDKWNEIDIFDIRFKEKEENEPKKLIAINEHKWAGWFDLYNKAYYEKFVPIRDDWKGYGPYDYYGMLVTQYAKQKGIDFQQWIIENQVIFEYSVGPLKDKGFSKYYKDSLTLKNIPNQRKEFEDKMSQYIKEWIIKNNL